MNDTSLAGTGQSQESTRWLLAALVGTAALAAGVIAAADIPNLVGNKWQVVGAAAAGVTGLALLVGLIVVVRAIDPVDDQAPASPVLAVTTPGGSSVGQSPAPAIDERPAHGDLEGVEPDDASASAGDGGVGLGDDAVATLTPTHGTPTVAAVAPPPDELSPGPTTTAAAFPSASGGRAASRRFRRARSWAIVTIVVAFVGMVGMTVAAIADGNNVERRDRLALQAELDRTDEGPITDPQRVAVQLTTPGLRRVARKMRCTGADIGVRPVQGWAVSGTFRNPTVVLFAPAPQCKNVEIALQPKDGFIYPTIDARLSTTSSTTTTTRPAGAFGAGPGAPAAGNGGVRFPANTPTSAAPVPAP